MTTKPTKSVKRNMALDQDSLFSLEVAVDTLRLDSKVGCRFPAVAFRLLDFPTLLVYHVEPDLGERIKTKIKADPLYKVPNQLFELQDRHGTFIVKRGKSCLFKASPNTLQAHLQTMPLYVMIVDTYPDVPKLVASCTVPLDSCIDEIYNDIVNLGLSVPSVHGLKGDYTVCNLMGREIGKIVLGIRLLSLGVGLLQHVPETSVAKLQKKGEISLNRETKDVTTPDQPEKVILYDLETLDKPVQVCISPEPMHVEDFQGQTEENLSNIGTQTAAKKKKKTINLFEAIPAKVNDEIDDFIITNTECPPPLFFNSEMEKPSSHSLLLSYYPMGIPAQANVYSGSDSDIETIRSEDRFSDSDTEVDSSKLVKPIEKNFNPKIINPPKKSPPSSQIHGSIAQLPILNALLQEIVTLQGGHLVDNQRRVGQKSSLSPPPSSRTRYRESPRLESSSHKKYDISKEQQKEHPSRMLSPRIKSPGRIHPRTSTPPIHVRHVCQGGQADVPSGQALTKSKGWTRYKSPAGVPKTKLQPGMTNTQRLRLAKTNPQLLQTLEKAEQERLQRRRQQLQRKAGVHQFSNHADLADVSTEISHHPMQEKTDPTAHHKKPIPTPRHSINSKEFTDTMSEKDIAPVMPSPRKGKQQTHIEDVAKNEQPDYSCYSEPHSSKIEVYVPSASVDDADTDNDDTYVSGLELDSPTVGSRRLNKTRVMNKPGFPVEDSAEFDKSSRVAKNWAQQIPDSLNERQRVKGDIDYTNKSGTLEGLSAGEELGLRCVVERYSDDESSKQSDHTDVSSYVSAKSHNSAHLANGALDKLTMPEKFKPASSAFSPDTFNESHTSHQPTIATREPFIAVSVSDMKTNTQDSTAYINQGSVDSTSSYTRTEQRSADVKHPVPSPRAPRPARNISVRTDSLSSYVPSDQIPSEEGSADGNTGDNYSDSFEECSEDESDIIVKPKYMKDIQIDPNAKMGYTWGY